MVYSGHLTWVKSFPQLIGIRIQTTLFGMLSFRHRREALKLYSFRSESTGFAKADLID